MVDVILIHGLSGSTKDMDYVAGRIGVSGYGVFNIALPGHGTVPEALLSVTMQDWIDAVESRVSACPDGVFIIGQSMGALLAINSAVKHPGKVRGIVLLAPAIKLYGAFNRFFMYLIYAYSRVLPLPHIYYVKNTGPDISDPDVKKSYAAYNRIPLNGLSEFERLRKMVLGQLGMVSSPVLIVYSTHDHTISGDAAEIIDSRIGSTIKQIRTLDESFHVISVDRNKETVADTAIEFLKYIDAGVK